MWSKVGIGGEHHRYYKHTEFRQNPRGDPKFLVDLTRNDPYTLYSISYYKVLLHILIAKVKKNLYNMAVKLRIIRIISIFWE